MGNTMPKRNLMNFAKDYGSEADERRIFLPYGRFKRTEYGVAIGIAARAYTEVSQETRLSRTFRWYDRTVYGEEQKKCHRDIVEAFGSGSPLDPDFVEGFFPVVLKMFPEGQRKALLRKHVYKTLEKLSRANEQESGLPIYGKRETLLGLAREFAAFIKIIEIDYKFDPDENFSSDETPPIQICSKQKSSVQIAYRSLLREADIDEISDIEEKTGISVDSKSMKRDVQDGHETSLRKGYVRDSFVIENLTGIKPTKTTIKRVYKFLFLEGAGRIIKEIEDHTGIKPGAKAIDNACRKILQCAEDEGGMFSAIEKMVSLIKAVGIEPCRNATEAGYRTCFISRWINAARSLRNQTSIDPLDTEIQEWLEQDKPN